MKPLRRNRPAVFVLLACLMLPPGLQAGEAALEWTHSTAPELMAHLGHALDFEPDAVPAAGPRTGGVLVARFDLDGDGRAEWVVVPDHLCSGSACEVVVLADAGDDGPLPGATLHRAASYGLPMLGGHDAHGRWHLVLQDLDDGPTCCAPRLPVRHGPDAAGRWGALGPAEGEWPVQWAADVGIDRGP